MTIHICIYNSLTPKSIYIYIYIYIYQSGIAPPPSGDRLRCELEYLEIGKKREIEGQSSVACCILAGWLADWLDGSK